MIFIEFLLQQKLSFIRVFLTWFWDTRDQTQPSALSISRENLGNEVGVLRNPYFVCVFLNL